MLGFAIIGCGKIAHRHAQLIKEFGKLIAVYDIDEQKGRLFADRYDTVFYASYDLLLTSKLQIDVLVICAPNWLHAPYSIKALNAGFHVLCEKPMAIHYTDCVEMIRAADKNQRQLFIVKQNRFSPPVAQAKQLIEEKELGKLYSFHIGCFWNRNKEYYEDSWHGKIYEDGGTLFTQFSHFIDILYWLMGEVKEVRAVTKNFAHPLIQFEDTGAVLFEMQSGAIGTLHYTVNSFEKNMEGSFTIIGEKGTIKIGGEYLDSMEYLTIKKAENSVDPVHCNHKVPHLCRHSKVYENLINVLLNGEQVYLDAHHALKTVEIIEKIYNAAKFKD